MAKLRNADLAFAIENNGLIGAERIKAGSVENPDDKYHALDVRLLITDTPLLLEDGVLLEQEDINNSRTIVIGSAAMFELLDTKIFKEPDYKNNPIPDMVPAILCQLIDHPELEKRFMDRYENAIITMEKHRYTDLATTIGSRPIKALVEIHYSDSNVELSLQDTINSTDKIITDLRAKLMMRAPISEELSLDSEDISNIVRSTVKELLERELAQSENISSSDISLLLDRIK